MKASYTTVNALVRRIADRYAALPEVEAVALGGSQTFSLSDFDIYVYASETIPLNKRAEVTAGAKRA